MGPDYLLCFLRFQRESHRKTGRGYAHRCKAGKRINYRCGNTAKHQSSGTYMLGSIIRNYLRSMVHRKEYCRLNEHHPAARLAAAIAIHCLLSIFHIH